MTSVKPHCSNFPRLQPIHNAQNSHFGAKGDNDFSCLEADVQELLARLLLLLQMMMAQGEALGPGGPT
jgi:hypothetical protein